MLNRLLRPAPGRENRALRRNLAANILDGALFAFGMSFVSLQTVLPVFVKRSGGSSIEVGLIPVLWTFGYNFPQIFVANYVQRIPLKKGLFLKTALVQRIPWLLLAIFTFLVVDRVHPSMGLFVFFVLFTLAAVAGSINLPIWFDLIVKLTPLELRGRLLAARNMLGALLGVLAGWVVKLVLTTIDYPANFALLFLLGFASMLASYIFLRMLVEERPGPAAEVGRKEYARALSRILRTQRNFRNYLVSDALMIAATMAGAFYAVHAIGKFGLSNSAAGTFTIVIMATTIIGNFFFGTVADRFGHKVNLLVAACSTAAACLIALVAPTPGLYLFVFVGAALASGLAGISRLAIVAELSSEGERPTYVALTNMVTAPFVLFGLLAGWLANRFGYNVVFVLAGILALASAIWLAAKVAEPRLRDRAIIQPAQYEA